MEPAGPAPGRLGPLLCLLIAVSCTWAGKHPHPSSPLLAPELRAPASQAATGGHGAVSSNRGRDACEQGYRFEN